MGTAVGAPDLAGEEALRRQIALEREALASSVESLRGDLSHAHPANLLDGKLPLAVGTAAAFGFVLAGGLGATMRLAATRRRSDRAGGWLRLSA
jgi:hypothetical protein